MISIVKLVVFLVILVVGFPDISLSQSPSFNAFAEVTVEDHDPAFGQDTRKVYTTSIRLGLLPSASFRAQTFLNAARRFYATAFSMGFSDVNNLRSTDLADRQVQVTYDAIYNYLQLFEAVSGDDAVVTDTIGSFSNVRAGLNAQTNIFSFFPPINDATSFTFNGNEICQDELCNGTYVTCNESTTGVSAKCVSQCKVEYCYNDGLCVHTDPNLPPSCRCPTYPDLWVLGAKCETKFALWLAILLAVIGLLILLIAIFIIVVCVRRKHRKLAKKRQLLDSVPKSHVNPTFYGDDIRMGTNEATTTSSAVNRNSVQRSALSREDSFETVTSSEKTAYEYRPRTRDDRRHTADARRDHGGRGRHRRSSSDDSRSRTRKADSLDERRATTSSSSGSENSDDAENPNDISQFEVDVNNLDLHSDAASSVAVSDDVKSSPIKWLPPKSNNLRPGWVPSLGPLMYDLPTDSQTDIAPTVLQDEMQRRRTHGTDV